jgi:hypothetical protein
MRASERASKRTNERMGPQLSQQMERNILFPITYLLSYFSSPWGGVRKIRNLHRRIVFVGAYNNNYFRSAVLSFNLWPRHSSSD